MVDLGNDFDATAHEPDMNFEPIPAGWYSLRIADSERKETKDGQGWYLQFEFEVLGPSHSGRKLWARFNLKNRNPDTVRIAQEQLAGLCLAAGAERVRDTAMLHNKVVDGLVKIQPARGQYEASNDLKGFRAPGAERRSAVAGASRDPLDDGGDPDFRDPMDDPWG